MARNPNYWGAPGVPDEIIFSSSTSADTMVQALRNGELDYVRGTGADLFDALATEPNIRTRRGLRQRLHVPVVQHPGDAADGYNGSTSALEDPAFRDALGYAIDRQALVDRVLNGHGVAGHDARSAVPRQLARRADNPRGFDIAEANQRARRRRLRARRRRQARRQGGQADRRCG